MRFFSIRTLMALIAGSATGARPLWRNASELWARVMLMLASWACLRCRAVGDPAPGSGARLVVGFRGAWLHVPVCLPQPLAVATHHDATIGIRTREGCQLFDCHHRSVQGRPIAPYLYRVVMIDGTTDSRTVSNSVYNSTPGEDLLATMEPANRWRSRGSGP